MEVLSHGRVSDEEYRLSRNRLGACALVLGRLYVGREFKVVTNSASADAEAFGELLSYLLAAPIGAALYSRFRRHQTKVQSLPENKTP